MSIFENPGGLLFFTFLGIPKFRICEHTGKSTEILIMVYAVEDFGRNYATTDEKTKIFLTICIKREVFRQNMRNRETENNIKQYICEFCDHKWSRRYDYVNHLKPKKHEKIRQKTEIFRQQAEKKTPTTAINDETVRSEKNTNDMSCKKRMKAEYFCDYCQFSTTVKKEVEKHRKSKQHIRNEIKEEDFIEIAQRFVCLSCDKIYNNYKTCWGHSKGCKGKPVEVVPEETENVFFEIVEQPAETKTTMPLSDGVAATSSLSIELALLKQEIYKEVCESVVGKILENNQAMIEKITETMTHTQALIQTQNNNSNNTIIQTNNNTTHNHCTINMFLNEKCKDAVNITEWANQLQVDYDHLYYTGENGFQKGLANLLVENLKLCDVYNRPIHFTDVKRDRMYIRDADEWTKHDNNEKLIEVLEISARQACIRLTEWMQEHEDVPDYNDLDSELGKQYLALMMNVIRPEVDRLKAYPKVMKELAKTAQLRKEDQQ